VYLDMKSLEWESECWELLNRHSHWHVWTDSHRGRKPNRPGILALYRPGRLLLAVYTRPGRPINTRMPVPEAAELPEGSAAVLWVPADRRKATTWAHNPLRDPPGLIAGTWPDVGPTDSRAVAPASRVQARTRPALSVGDA
jgi:hypothetical protein